jgi:hypothetical protein
VKELDATDLRVDQPLKGGGRFSIVCKEDEVILMAVDANGKPLNWSCDIIGGEQLKSIIKEVGETSVTLSESRVDYCLKLGSHAGSCRQLNNGSVRLLPGRAGKLVLKLDTSNVAAVAKKANAELSRK